MKEAPHSTEEKTWTSTLKIGDLVAKITIIQGGRG
jgi:hypothetical protein